MLATQMNRINPAYHDGSGYTPFPTPIPERKSEDPLEKGNDVSFEKTDSEITAAAVHTPFQKIDAEAAQAGTNADLQKIKGKDTGSIGSNTEANDIDADGETDLEESAGKPQPDVTSTLSDSAIRRASSTPAVQDNVDAEKGFDGLSFQEAQEKIVSELIQRKDEE